ncbi:hypothetical protein mRhiFer1_008014 [Rhinolophus ferrumequinum]|uniref:Uncharacterized protein n=1 Tax=Rhinolophus ferrumequinum TaxID=59479 RepID=A0A7J7WQM8_RHIFE|nr:hypothetical protein mRhiFer1_008014 [Rhinolophus ferrumequinum]
MQRLSVNPLLTQACLARCKDQSQTPRATGPTRKGPQVPLSPSSVDAASPSGVLSGCSSASLVPLSPGLRRAVCSPHCPSLGVFPFESILGQSPSFLALQRVRGSHPPSQAEQSEPLLGPGLSLGLLPPIAGEESESPCFRSASRGHSSVGGRTEGWAVQQGSRSREEWSQAPLRCPPLCGPLAHLFCALVTYESPPSLGPHSVLDTPWGLPVKLLALRILQCRAKCPWTGLRGGQDHQSFPTPPHIPGASRSPQQAGLTPATVLGRVLRQT